MWFRMVTCVFQNISACGSERSPVCFRSSAHVVQNTHLCVLEHVQNSHLCVSEHQCIGFRTVTYVFQTISACGSEQSPMCFRPSVHVVRLSVNGHPCVSECQCARWRAARGCCADSAPECQDHDQAQ